MPLSGRMILGIALPVYQLGSAPTSVGWVRRESEQGGHAELVSKAGTVHESSPPEPPERPDCLNQVDVVGHHHISSEGYTLAPPRNRCQRLLNDSTKCSQFHLTIGDLAARPARRATA